MPIYSMGLVYLPIDLPYKLTIHVGKYTIAPLSVWYVFFQNGLPWQCAKTVIFTQLKSHTSTTVMFTQLLHSL